MTVRTHAADVRTGVRIEVRTVIWMVTGAAVSLAAGIVAGSMLVCVYVLVASAVGLATHARPRSSPVGIAIALAAVVVMPWLGVAKRRIVRRIDSDALRGDAVESFTCGYGAAAGYG